MTPPPPRPTMWASSCFMHQKALVRLTASIRCQVSPSSSWKVVMWPVIPALLKATSRRPWSATTRPTTAAARGSFLRAPPPPAHSARRVLLGGDHPRGGAVAGEASCRRRADAPRSARHQHHRALDHGRRPYAAAGDAALGSPAVDFEPSDRCRELS